jgi:vanillate monooxygenase ferredoxin subunit
VEQAWINVVVLRKAKEADGICSFELASAHGDVLPPFSAGSHIDVEVSAGRIRQYSLCNDPNDQHRYVIAVLRDPNSRGGSVSMIDRVHDGATLRISAPRNHFPLVPGAKLVVLLAGGIGITPILSMAERLSRSEIPFRLVYANRSRSRTAFIDRIANSRYGQSVLFHFDEECGGRVIDLRKAIGEPVQGSHLYVCGPTGLIKAALEAAAGNGWHSTSLHREYFQPLAESAAEVTEAFRIRISSTGNDYLVPPHRSVVEVLAEHGVNIPVSCEQGVCGTCVTRLLDGIPDHRDMFMTDDEHARNDQFTPCCSRARTPLLVLDL